MRVVIAVHGTERYSGIPKYSYLLALALARKGVNVKVIMDSPLGQQQLSGLCTNGVTPETTVIGPPVRDFLSTAQFSLNLSRYLSENTEFDILHTTHVTPFFYLLRRNRKKVVFQPFGNELFTLAGRGLNSLYCKLTQPILRLCGNRADALVSEGEFQHADMAKWYKRPESDLRVLPLGIDLPSLPTKRAYARRDVVRFLSINGLYKYERMDLLINTLKRAYRVSGNISLTIVGAGPLEIYLKRMASGYPIRFMKEISETKLGEVYREADVFVCTSRETDYQMGILEAMAVGLPILSATTRVWLPPEAVQVVPDKLSGAMALMATWPSEKAAKVGEAMHRVAQQYSFSEVADRALKIYEEIL